MNDKEFDLRVEEGHSLEGLMASQGCVIFESEPFYIYVNGREILCDLNTMWDLSAEYKTRVERLFEGKLNEYSNISLNCLFLNDRYNTPIAHVRIGRDPFGFYSDLPSVSFDDRGNLISLTSYDIYEGYFVYSFFYDDEDRITYAEERCYKISLNTGRRSKDCSCYTCECRYTEKGGCLHLTQRWDSLQSSDKPDVICFEKYIEGFSVMRRIYESEEEFQSDIEICADWAGATTME